MPRMKCEHCGRALKAGEIYYADGRIDFQEGEEPLCLCVWSMLSFVAELEANGPYDWKERLEQHTRETEWKRLQEGGFDEPVSTD